ncbi:MAG: hypothetical protein AAFY28_09145 [Actinomycetota bacterium]
MTVAVEPTLEAMLHIYSLSADGGDRSPRFQAYLEACRSGRKLQGFNPMTTKPVAAAIESLLAFDAERIALEAGRTATDAIGADDDVDLFLSVAAPGMWTDARATTIEHRLAPRHHGEVLLWFDEAVTAEAVRAAAAEQTVRAAWWARSDSQQPTVAEVSRREGLAGVVAGRTGDASARAEQILHTVAADRSRGSAVAYLFGDDAAALFGYTALGLDVDEGLGHALSSVQRLRLDHV